MDKTTLVLGASFNPSRYSYLAINRLVEAGEKVIGLGLKAGNLEGIDIFKEKIPLDKVHTVTMYLNPLNQRKHYDYVLTLQPERVIFNPGTENSEFYVKLRAAGIAVVEACTLVLLSTNQYQTQEGEQSV